MFILVEVRDTMRVEPSQFNRDLHEVVTDLMDEKYSNRVIPDVGLCVCVHSLDAFHPGPVAVPPSPRGRVSSQVPGGVGTAVRTVTRAVTTAVSPTPTDSGIMVRSIAPVRRVRNSDSTAATRTAISSTPK